MSSSEFRITHPDVPEERQQALKGRIEVARETFLEVYLDGYGTADTVDGPPICICLDNNQEPVLYVWDDINNDAPSHIIPLAGAKEPPEIDGPG